MSAITPNSQATCVSLVIAFGPTMGWSVKNNLKQTRCHQNWEDPKHSPRRHSEFADFANTSNSRWAGITAVFDIEEIAERMRSTETTKQF